MHNIEKYIFFGSAASFAASLIQAGMIQNENQKNFEAFENCKASFEKRTDIYYDISLPVYDPCSEERAKVPLKTVKITLPGLLMDDTRTFEVLDTSTNYDLSFGSPAFFLTIGITAFALGALLKICNPMGLGGRKISRLEYYYAKGRYSSSDW